MEGIVFKHTKVEHSVMNKSISKMLDVSIGVFCILLLLAEIIAVLSTGFEIGPAKEGINTVLVGIYVDTWGLMFFFSYFLEKKSFFFRGLMWVCLNLSRPRGRRMAFFYAGLSFILGSMGILSGMGIVK